MVDGPLCRPVYEVARWWMAFCAGPSMRWHGIKGDFNSMQQSDTNAHWAVTQTWFHLSHALVSWLVLGVIAALGGAFIVGMWFAQHRFDQTMAFDPTEALQQLQADHEKITELRAQTETQLISLNRQVGRIEAHITRVNVLGEKLRLTLGADPLVYDFLQEPTPTGRLAINPASEPLVSRLKAYEGVLQGRMLQWEAMLHRAQSSRATNDVRLKGRGESRR